MTGPLLADARLSQRALVSTHIFYISVEGDLAAEQRQNVAWGQIGELQRVNRSPRFSHEHQTFVSARFGGVAAKSSRDET